MQFATLATLTFATIVLGTGTNHPSITQCQTFTSTIDPSGTFNTCTVLACLEIDQITQKCGCSTIPTTTVVRTACPTSCGTTSYITAIEDCFPTQHPSSTVSTTATTTPNSSHTSKSSTHQPPDTTHPPLPPPSTTAHPNPYTNTTKTVTTTTHVTTTLTTCPAKETCTGQTTTYTSTQVCPTSTCVCVLPSVTFLTTVLPVPTNSQGGEQQTNAPATTSRPSNTPPAPTSTPILVDNVASKWGVGAGMGLLGAFIFAVAGFL